MDSGLDGQRILVTGASGGIGAATARLLVAEGAHVVLHHHDGVARAQALAAELGPRRVTLTRADLTDEVAVDAMWQQVLDGGPIDAVVANAGIWPSEPAPLHRMSLARWRTTLDTDLTSVFLTCRGFLRQLASERRDAASIVLVGSTAGLFGEAGHADYAAAKAALAHGLTTSLKNEIVRLSPFGRVNCVAPGWVATPMSAAALADPELVARATRTVALRKVATAEDVAATIAWLLSPRLAGHVSGAVVPVHGGMEGRVLHE